MTLSNGDMLALFIALTSTNLVLVIAFRRIYVLERRLRNLRGF